MKRSDRRRRFFPRVDHLESRIALSATSSYIGLDGTDLVGPTASVGPDGIKDIHLTVSNIPIANSSQTPINSLTVTAPSAGSAFQWIYGDGGLSKGNNPEAGPNTEVFIRSIPQGATTETADVFINPIVQYVDPSTGKVTNQTLPNNAELDLSVSYTYNGTRQTDSWPTDSSLQVTATGLGGSLRDHTPTLPALGMGTYAATFGAQTSDGYAHVDLSGLPMGSTIASATLNDVAGLSWNPNISYGRPELGMLVTYSNNKQNVDFAFPPLRDEAGTTMTIRFQLKGFATQYVTDFSVPASTHTNPALCDPAHAVVSSDQPLLVSPVTGTDGSPTPDMVSYTDSNNQQHTVDIQTLLNMAESTSSPRYTKFTLTDGSTGGVYLIDKPLWIYSGLILQGADSNVTLEFTFSSTNPPAAQPSGAINFRSSHVTLDNLKIRFSNSSVDLNNGGSAILDGQDLSQVPKWDINLLNLDIQGVYDPNFYNLADSAYETMMTIKMGNFDSGTIENNTVSGGVISVQWGPWQILNNTIVGAVAGTVCDGSFGLYTCHDITLQGNSATDPNPSADGNIDRFFAANRSGYDFVIENNSFSQNVGLIAPNPGGSSSGNPRNNPEEMLFEDYRIGFEGSTAAIAISSSVLATYNRRVIAIPTAMLVNGGGGSTLSILDGSSAGTWIPVSQQFQSTDSQYTYYVLGSPLPRGTFDFAIAPDYVNITISNNTLDMRGTVSTGLDLGSTLCNVQVMNNTFLGDASTETTGYGTDYSQAVRIEATPAEASQIGPYTIDGPYYSFDTMSGVLFEYNNIINLIGGVKMYMDAWGPSTSTYGAPIPTSR